VDQLKNLEVNQLYVIQEGGKILKSGPLTQTKTPAPGKG
jgi:enediyne biosynthesis protein E4